MKQIDEDNIVQAFGLSKELTEYSEVEARVYNDHSEFKWAIHIYPPINRNDNPEYIHCSDCSKEEWILNKKERDHLCEILTPKIWELLLFYYEEEMIGYDSRKINIANLKMPDYSKLPII